MGGGCEGRVWGEGVGAGCGGRVWALLHRVPCLPHFPVVRISMIFFVTTLLATVEPRKEEVSEYMSNW